MVRDFSFDISNYFANYWELNLSTNRKILPT